MQAYLRIGVRSGIHELTIEYRCGKLRNIEPLPEKVLNKEYFTWQIEKEEYPPKNYYGMEIFTSGELRNTEFLWLEYSASTPD